MRTKTYMLLLCFLGATASSLASADALVNVKTEVVKYDDIRLISPVGAAVLYSRLHSAAVRACGGPISGPTQLGRQQRSNVCQQEALAKAVNEVNNPILTQYHEKKRNAPIVGEANDQTATAAR